MAAVCFSAWDHGRHVACVGAGGDQRLILFDWRTGTVVVQASTHLTPPGPDPSLAGSAPPAGPVLAVVSHPSEPSLVTCGVDHLIWWRRQGGSGPLQPAHPVYGGLGRRQTFLCAAYCFVRYQMFGGERWEEGCPGGLVTLTGTADGFIYLWEDHYLAKVTLFYVGKGRQR